MNNLTQKMKVGGDGVYIPMVGENDLFVPWSVVKHAEDIIKETIKNLDRLPWGVRQLAKKAMKNVPTRLSAINTIVETACAVKQMGGRIIWKEIEYEELSKALEQSGHRSK